MLGVVTVGRMSTVAEAPIAFQCHGDRLIGIATQPRTTQSIGVLIIVGGPQYRSGSHRQFTLLARRLAQEGFASLRFDYRGMGDSEGDLRNFESINDDIRAAIDAFMASTPQVLNIVLWGLCDAASAAMYYAHTDSRVVGQVSLNPWTHSEASAAKARLKHYYLNRLMQRAFWIKLLSGGVKVGKSVGELKHSAQQAGGRTAADHASADPRHGSPGYIARMLQGLKAFKGRTQFILSGEDMVAKEFQLLCRQDKAWARCMRAGDVTLTSVAKANHTFSTAGWRAEAEDRTLAWLREQVEARK